MPTHSPFHATVRACTFVGVTLALMLLFTLLTPCGPAAQRRVRRAWCGACLRLLDVQADLRGAPYASAPTLFVANHVSYLDILLLGAVLDATFIGKAEIQDWPLFGRLGRMTGTFFIRRYWRDALIQRNALAARMRRGESFILFAEGTSSDGLDVAPFKTSLLSVVEPWVVDRPVAVQPVCLAFRSLGDGTPVTAANADLYAWYGDDELVPHLWRTLGGPGLRAEIVCGAPVLSWSVVSRKRLGRRLREEVRAHLGGRQGALPATPAPEIAMSAGV